MKWASNKRMYLEVTLLRAIQTVGQVTLGEVLEALKALREGGALPERVKAERPQKVSLPASTQQNAPVVVPVRLAPKAPPLVSLPVCNRRKIRRGWHSKLNNRGCARPMLKRAAPLPRQQRVWRSPVPPVKSAPQVPVPF